jgi:outer membrane protein, multidrug efflux system
MIKREIQLWTYLLFLLALASCKVPQVTSLPSGPALPADFGRSGQAGAGPLNWRAFFTDPLLVALLDTTLKNNPDLLMAAQHLERASAEVQFAKGLRLPVGQGGGAASLRRFGRYTMDGAGNAGTDIEPGRIVPTNLPDFFVGVQTAWEVDLWGKLRARQQAAALRLLASQAGRQLVQTSLVAEVAEGYYQLLALDLELDIIRESIRLQEEALEIVRVQKQAAAANELAVQQFEALVLDAKALELEIAQQIVLVENRVNFLAGRFAQPVARNRAAFVAGPERLASAGLPSDLLRHRPDLQQAERLLAATKADAQAARLAFYPSFNMVGMIGFQAFNPRFLFSAPQSVAYNLLGNLAAPLVNRSAIKAQFRVAQAHQVEAYAQYQKTVLLAYAEVRNELAQIDNLAQRRTLTAQRVDVLTQAIGTSLALFRTGRATYLEVLLTQQALLDARMDLVVLQQQQFQANLQLYKALGGGWE